MKILLLVVGLTFGGMLASATTTDMLELTAGGLIATITDNGGCAGSGCLSLTGDTNAAAGTVTINGTIDGWTINVVSGTSHSPGLTPFGLDETSLTATCAGGPCTANPLHVLYSDINFTVPVPAGGFSTTYSSTVTGSGTTSESAYVDNTNTLFGEPATGLIATVGPFVAPFGANTKSGGPAGVPSYSLTLDQVFTSTGASTSFSSDGNVTAVPEPAAVVLLGAALLLCSSRLRRKKA